MPRLITLTKKGPLGPKGTQVWVNDDEPDEAAPSQAPEKKTD